MVFVLDAGFLGADLGAITVPARIASGGAIFFEAGQTGDASRAGLYFRGGVVIHVWQERIGAVDGAEYYARREDEGCAFHAFNVRYVLLSAVSSAGRIRPDIRRISPP